MKNEKNKNKKSIDLFTLNFDNEIVLRVNNSTIFLSYLFLILNLTLKITVPHL